MENTVASVLCLELPVEGGNLARSSPRRRCPLKIRLCLRSSRQTRSFVLSETGSIRSDQNRRLIRLLLNQTLKELSQSCVLRVLFTEDILRVLLQHLILRAWDQEYLQTYKLADLCPPQPRRTPLEALIPCRAVMLEKTPNSQRQQLANPAIPALLQRHLRPFQPPAGRLPPPSSSPRPRRQWSSSAIQTSTTMGDHLSLTYLLIFLT